MNLAQSEKTCRVLFQNLNLHNDINNGSIERHFITKSETYKDIIA